MVTGPLTAENISIPELVRRANKVGRASEERVLHAEDKLRAEFKFDELANLDLGGAANKDRNPYTPKGPKTGSTG